MSTYQQMEIDAYVAHVRLAHHAMESALAATEGVVKRYYAHLALIHAQSARQYTVAQWQYAECADLIREAQSVLSVQTRSIGR